MSSRRWLYVSGFVLFSVLFVGAGLLGLADGLAVLSGGVAASEEFLLVAMLGAAAEWIVVALVCALFAVVFLAATVVSVLRDASIPRDDRLVPIVERLERQYPILRQFDAAEKVEPTAEDRQQRLKSKYVDGELSEREFERQMDALMDETDADDSHSEGRTDRDVGKQSQ